MVQSGCGVSGSTAYYAAASGSQMARRLYPYFNGMNFYDTNDPRGLNFSGANYGVSGYKTADVDGLVAAAIAQGPSIVGYAAGINDLLHTADSAATIMGRIQTSVRKFTRLGIRVLLANIRPIGTSGDLGLPADDATVRPRLATLNGLIATFCSTEPLVVLADLYAELDNGSGQLASADGADGVHVSVSGAVKESRGWIKALRKIDRRVAWTPNIYEGNALPNFDMRQTGGTAGTGASGSVVPAGFRILRTSGGSSTVITNVITSELDAREKELLIRITPDTSADYETFSFDKSDFDLAPLANKWAIAYARVDVEADVQLRNLRFGIAGFSHDFLGTPATDLLPTGGYQFELMTPPFKVGSSPGTALFHLQPTIKGTGFGGTYMDIKLYRMGVMPIPVDPDWHRNLIQGS